MGFLARLLSRRRPPADGPGAFTLTSPEAVHYFGGGDTSTGQRLSADKVLTWSAWWRGVTFLAKTLAKCPCAVYKTDPRGEWGMTPALNHPAYKLLRWKPNEYQTAFQFRLALAGHAINRGNGYAWIRRVGPVPVELIILDPDDVTPVAMDGRVWYVLKVEPGKERKLVAEDVFHLRGFGFDGHQGYPAWQMARESIALGLSAEKFAATRYKNSARPSVVLETPNKMNDQAVIRLRENWEQIHSGVDNAGRTAILDNGLKASKLSFSPEEMQEVESAGLRLRDAANFLGIPSSKMGDVAGIKYASKEQDDRAALEDGADYWLTAFEFEAWDKLLLESEKDANSRIVSFDRDKLISFDLMTKANYWRTATGGRGWASPAEAREAFQLEPSDEPDIERILTPLNMGQGGADNRPRDLRDPEPGRPSEEEANDADASSEQANTSDSNIGESSINIGTPLTEDRMSAVREAARVALADASRRMVRRVALHASRAAKEPRKFCAWVDSFAAEHEAVAVEMLEPARFILMAATPGNPLVESVATHLLSEIKGAYGRLAETTSSRFLAESVEKLNAELELAMPGCMCDKFLGESDE